MQRSRQLTNLKNGVDTTICLPLQTSVSISFESCLTLAGAEDGRIEEANLRPSHVGRQSFHRSDENSSK